MIKVNVMDKKQKHYLASVLEENEEVIFEYDSMYYNIFLRSDGTYDVNVYDDDSFISEDDIDPVDGGCCSGCSVDAIEFMLDEECL